MGRLKTNRLIVFFLSFSVLVSAMTALSFAHKLSVFAWVEGKYVIVEGTLGGGKRPKQGTVLVYDGKDTLLLKTPLEKNGTARFPLPPYKTGLKVVVDIGEGHQSYWILTPHDIKSQLEE